MVISPAQTLRSALATGSEEEVAAAAILAAQAGLDDGHLAAIVAEQLAPWLPVLPPPVVWALCDVPALASGVEADRRAVLWAVAFGLLAEAQRSTQLRSQRDAQPQTQRDDQPKRPAAPTLADDSGESGSNSEWLALSCLSPGDGAAAAVTALKVLELSDLAGTAVLLPALGAAIANYPQQLAYTRGHAERRLDWQDSLAAASGGRDQVNVRSFVEPKFRLHVLDGGCRGALRAVQRGVEVGIAHELLAQSVVMAAADRLWRFDAQHDDDDSVAEGRGDAELVLVAASAMRQLRTRVPAQVWLQLLYFCSGLVAVHAPLDKPIADRIDLPEPQALPQSWDHGPEIAKIIAHLSAGRATQAIAVLRGYFLLGLPEQPLCALLREAAVGDFRGRLLDQARAISCLRAAIDEFAAAAGHPQRELILAAAMASVCAPNRPRHGAQQAQLAWQRAHLHWKQRRLVGDV
ncbi:MAG: hypothetical protein EXR77_02215 [Myxococcales bacterium]|nr:hypothetical protein [Myxococcales bacterium]